MASRPLTTVGVFRSIPATRRMYIPAPATARDRPLLTKPLGTMVAAGETLAIEQTEADAAPLAPVAGTIIQTTRASLLNGESVDAIEFQPADSTPDQPSSLPDSPPHRGVL